MAKQYRKFKAYFYNGFNKPQLMATSLTGLLKISLTDTYQGDKTSYLREAVNDYKKSLNWDYFVEDMEGLGFYIDPTYETFREANRQWFDNDTLDAHLDEWKKEAAAC